ncbi:MAG: hypothetical protein WCV56_01235 [Candidatus Omnitrophota bacterium]
MFVRKCPKCGKEYDDSWGVCLDCGGSLVGDDGEGIPLVDNSIDEFYFWESVGNFSRVAVACAVFLGCYIYCVATYGFLFGLGLGWLPSLIVAFIALRIPLRLWLIVVLLLVAVVLFILKG